MKQTAKKLLVKRLMRKVAELLAAKELTIVAVTGTVGKTSAKVAIAQVLEQAGMNVGYSEDSYNSDVGLPLSIFGLKVPDRLGDVRSWRKIMRAIDAQLKDFPHDVLVLEIAEDDLSLMLPFMQLIQPRIAVVTSLSEVHTERMEGIEKLSRDITELIKPAQSVVCNADFKELERMVTRRRAATYGLAGRANVRFKDVTHTSKGTLNAALAVDGKDYKVATQLIAEHGLSALLAAASVALQLDVPAAQVAKSLSTIPPLRGRMNLLPGLNDSYLIDDSYNSSPHAVLEALKTLKAFPVKGQRIAVLGNMNELGTKSEAAHREIGAAAAKSADLLVVIGVDAERYMAPAAIDAGMGKENVKVFRTPYEAGHFLKKQLAKGDVVLVKGSQNGVFSEEVSRILLDSSQNPTKVLVRQSRYWKRKKKKAFAL